ncbi:MAG: hypothetical protein HY321_00315 [Armatimonadetes bacterium]|nr:hypothetical protein [Armatimonadota bacterium]
MGYPLSKLCALASISVLAPAIGGAAAASEDLGNGFLGHGVATPSSNRRGIVATVDGDGRNVVLVWLSDHRGGYCLLVIDAETGKSDQVPLPFPPGDYPYASILSSGNKFYTHFNKHFIEFDPARRAFTFCRETAPQMAMGMTEDDNGVIWSVTHPSSGVVSFNPKTREFKDYGHVYPQNWRQYQRYVAADDAGWIYFAIGNTASQIIAFDPESGTARPMLPEGERVLGTAYVYRDLNGKVYGVPLRGAEEGWYEFHGGEGKRIGRLKQKREKPIITRDQMLFHADFPDGKRLVTCDVPGRLLEVEDPKTGQVKQLHFDYQSNGAYIMGLAVSPDGTISGASAAPARCFSYDPRTDQLVTRPAYSQWNVVARQGDRFYVGGYGGGFLLEWDPARPWVDTEKGNKEGNPAYLTDCTPTVHRPHDLLAHPDGKTLILAGTPGYGYTGGGLLFWDRESGTGTLVEHTAILPQHSTHALVALPGGKLLGGTTTNPGTGGEKKAEVAELYLMDMAAKRVEWHQALFPGVQAYMDLFPGPRGLVYGFANQTRFFVFDPVERKVVHEEQTEAQFGPTTWHQGPRIFVPGPDGAVYILFTKKIARVNPETFAIELLAESPVTISAGGDFLDGRIYFAGGSRLYSYKLRD